MWITLALTTIVVVLYVTEWVSLEMTSLGTLAVLLVLFQLFPAIDAATGERLVTAADLLAGFSNPALLTVLALLVVGEGLIRAGALDSVAEWATHPRLSAWVSVLVIIVLVAVLSAFLNNTPVVVIFIPILQAMAVRLNVNASRVMMPLSYAAILGGMTTLIGSSTNLLVSSALIDLGLEPLSFFEITPAGLLMAGLGLCYVILVLPRVLPERAGMASRMTHHGKQFISQIVVPSDSHLVGEKAVAGAFKSLPDITVRMIQRGEHAELPPFDDYAVKPGDTLVIAATRAALTEISSRHPGLLHPPRRLGVDRARDRLRDGDTDTGDANANARREKDRDKDRDGGKDLQDQEVLVETMVTPSSRLIGANLQQLGFRQRYRCLVIGIQRRARMIRASMTQIRLEAGDNLLIQGRWADTEALGRERDLVVLSGTTGVLPRRHNAGLAAGIFITAVGLAALGIVPIVVAAIVAAVLMIAVQAVNLRQATRALDRKILLVVVAALALGQALENTGAAAVVANTALGLFQDLGPAVILSLFFLIVAGFTNVLTNNATAVLFTPVGINLAAELGVDPHVFAITTVLAANCSFASPVGYQTNLLIMGPGHYTFSDYTRAGLPLLLLVWVAFSLFAPWYWSL
ncbi:SLC13 family permease [Roseospira visakhapatnamensis]|uniref:Di/tricarboxylate transporter n=1 Tax=Roseospira visakhapatnamensis TaxID=390880 RepID=A0A7W6REB4_9PROT|nr:SLC13 family permease [Roseospira visakhapatnamensis]MBB4266903.1 di/tricarboxylate transporter [Roseospira visakhapatnamensis]